MHWLLQTGTLPLEDREQVRGLTTWADAHYNEVLCSQRAGVFDVALASSESARALSRSAGHVCRQS